MFNAVLFRALVLVLKTNRIKDYYRLKYRSRDGSVGIARSYRLDNRSSIPGRNNRLFTSPTAFRPALGPIQPPLLWLSETHSLG
jgi:hypothetical protein